MKNHIRILFWNDKSSNRARINNYSEAIFNGTSLSFNIKNMELNDLIFERISKALKLNIGKYKIENIIGTVSIYNLNIDDQTISYAIDSVLGNFLHINEYTKSAWDRSRINLNYKSPFDHVYVKNPNFKSSYTVKKYSLSMSYRQRYTTGNNLYQVNENGNIVNKKFSHKTPYVIFKISKIFDNVIIDTFLSIFTRLMYYYNNILKNDVIEYLTFMFPINLDLRVEQFVNTIFTNMKNIKTVSKDDVLSYLIKNTIMYDQITEIESLEKLDYGVYNVMTDLQDLLDLSTFGLVDIRKYTYLSIDESGMYLGSISINPYNIFIILYNLVKTVYKVNNGLMNRIFMKLENQIRKQMCIDYEFFKFLDDQGKYINQLTKNKPDKNNYMKLKFNKRNDNKLHLPDLFIKQYPRNCACTHQPIQINKNDIGEWKKRTIGNTNKERQVLRFEADDDAILYFVCPNDSISYPGLKKNNLTNNKKYPFIPCCYKEKQGDIKKITLKKKQTKTKKHIIKTNKILSDGRIGVLPEKLLNFISEYTDEKIYRFGVPNDSSSFIHCVLRALEFQDYMDSENKIDFVVDFRMSLLNDIDVSIVSQEMYNVEFEKIEHVVKNSTYFFDPSYFYRILEIMFDINIFVFEQKNNDGVYSIIDIQSPRHEYKYFRNVDLEKPTLVLYQHRGSDLNKSELPQCEIIVLMSDLDDMTFLYDKNDLTENILTLFQSSLSTIDIKRHIHIEENLSESFFHDSFNSTIVSQNLDPYGKLQSINIKYTTIDSQDIIMTLLIPPSYPRNLRVDEKQIRTDVNIVLEMFDGKLPDYIFTEMVENDNLIIGFWYSDVYILINPESVSKELYDELIVKENKSATDTLIWSDDIKRRYLLRKKNRVNMSILLLMFIKYYKENKDKKAVPRKKQSGKEELITSPVIKQGLDSSKVVDDFFDKYVILKNVDENDYYVNDINILYSLKEYNLKNMIKQLKIHTHNMIIGNKFNCYSEKYCEQLHYFVSYYFKTLEPNENDVNFVNELFLTENDFRKSSDFILFDSKNKLDNWYMTQEQTFIVHNKINKTDEISEKPFFLSFDYKIFIVQRVEGNLNHALYVAKYWNDFQVNLGYEIQEFQEEEIEIENIEYNMFNISQDGVQIPIIVDDDVNINILKYGKIEKYAVLIWENVPTTDVSTA